MTEESKDSIEYIICACGCGTQISKYNKWGKARKFIQSHIWRGRKHKPESLQKISENRSGKYIGEKSYWFGKHIPKEAVEKQIQTKKERYVKEKHGMFGKHHSEESKHKMSESAKGKQDVVYSSGYKYLYMPDHPNADKDGRLGEHVYVMSQYLGRPLEKGEHTHHKNKKRDDNRIENLELHTASTHMQTHRKEYKDSIVGRTCGLCGSHTTSMAKKKDKKTGKYYEAPDWRHLVIHGSMWLCRKCFNREKYYKVKRW